MPTAADVVQRSNIQRIPYGFKLNPDGSCSLMVYNVNETGGAAGPTTDREMAVAQYRVKTASTGASVGDTITSIRVIDVSGASPAQVGATVWYNETTQGALSAAPGAATLEPLATGGLTNAQFVAGLSGIATTAVINTLIGKLPDTLGAKTGALSLSFVPASDAVFTIRRVPKEVVNKSTTVVTAGTAVEAAAANAQREGFSIQAPVGGDVWFNTLATAVLDSPSIRIAAGGYYETPPGGAGLGALSVNSNVAGSKVTVREW